MSTADHSSGNPSDAADDVIHAAGDVIHAADDVKSWRGLRSLLSPCPQTRGPLRSQIKISKKKEGPSSVGGGNKNSDKFQKNYESTHREEPMGLEPEAWFSSRKRLSLGVSPPLAARPSWHVYLFFLLNQSLLTTLFAKSWLKTHGREAHMKYHLLAPR